MSIHLSCYNTLEFFIEATAMAPRSSRDDKSIILGGVSGAAFLLLCLYLIHGANPTWTYVTIAGLSDPHDKVTQIVGYNASTQRLYVQMQSGTIYRCHESAGLLALVATCQKDDYESALQDLQRSYQCQNGMTFPTSSPPGTPVSQLESYLCGMGQFQTNHIVLPDGGLWQLTQGVTEDDEYVTIIIAVVLSIFGFVAGMIITAILLVLERRLHRSSQ